MAERSLNLREMNARGIYLSERGLGGGVDQRVHARMMAEMKNGLSAADAFRKVLSEDRDLRGRYERAHERPLELCETPSSGKALADFISSDSGEPVRDMRRRMTFIEESAS